MFVNERFIKIPYQEYKVALQHASIRKLTVMEWSLLRIVRQFGEKREYKDYSLERFYTDILGIDNSEMLLKPCVNQLISLDMITIEGFSDMSMVVRIKLGEIKITEKGQKSLEDGYLLGLSQDTDETVYMDVISDKMMGDIQDYSDQDTDHTAKVISKGQSNYIEFPAERFVREINEGQLFKDRYYDSRRWVESAVCSEGKEQWRTTLLVLEQTRDNKLICNFPVDTEILDLVRKMASCPFECANLAKEWGEKEPLPESGKYGSKMIRPFLSSLEYSENVFIPESIYNLIHREDARAFEGKTVFIMGGKEFRIDDYNGLIYLPASFDIPDLVYYDDKNDSYKLFVKHDHLDGNPLDVYFAEDAHASPDILKKLFSVAGELAEKHPEIIAVFSMPIFKVHPKDLNTLYSRCVSRYSTFREVIQFAARVAATSRRLHSNDIQPDVTSDYVCGLLNRDDPDAIIADLRFAYQYYYNLFDSQSFLALLLKAAASYSGKWKIASIESILALAESFCKGKYDQVAYSELASKNLVPTIQATDYDVLYSGLKTEYKSHANPVFTPYAEYLRFAEAYRSVKEMLPDFDWDNEYTKDDLLGKLIECPNIQKVNEYIDLMTGIAADQTKSECRFFRDNCLQGNALLLKEILGQFILPDGEPAPIYIIDTCAFMHTPDILDYFREDEIVRIPQTVLQELDKHKDSKNPDLHFPAANACKSIEKHNTKARLGNLLTFDLEPQDYPDLLPVGFTYSNNNRLSPDNLILSCAFRYKAFRPTIITDDTNFRNISRSQGIAVKAWNVFITERGGSAVRTSASAPKKGTNPASAAPVIKTPSLPTPAKPVPAVSKHQPPVAPAAEMDEARKKLREEWLARPVDDLAAPQIGVAPKVIKALTAADIKTIKKLMECSDGTIRVRIKAVSLRVGAIEAKKLFDQFIATAELHESEDKSDELQSNGSLKTDSELSMSEQMSSTAASETKTEENPLPEQRMSAEPVIRKSSALVSLPKEDDASVSVSGSVLDNTPLEKMGLSPRTYNCLHRAGYTVSGGFVHLSDEQLLKIRNLGQRGVDEIRDWVTKNRLNESSETNNSDSGKQPRELTSDALIETKAVESTENIREDQSTNGDLSTKWIALMSYAETLRMQPERLKRSVLFSKWLKDFITTAEEQKPKLAEKLKAQTDMEAILEILQSNPMK